MTTGRFSPWIGAVLIVLSGALLYLSTANLTWLRPYVTNAAAGFTGRALNIGGDFRFKVLPTPTFLAEDVTLANSDWGSEPAMLEIEHLVGEISLFSLLDGPILVRSLRLDGVKVLIEVDSEGQSNMPGTVKEDEPGFPKFPEISTPVIFGDTVVERVAITLRSHDYDDRVVTIDRLQMEITGSGTQWADLTGRALEQPLALTGTYGPVEALGTGEPMTVDLDGSLGDLLAKLSGQLGASVELNFQMKAPDLGSIFDHADVDLPLAGALDVNGMIVADEDRATAVVATSIGDLSGRGEVTLTGGITAISATLNDLAAVGETLDFGPLPEGDLELFGDIRMDKENLLLESFTAKIGESRIEGTGQIGRAESTLNLRVEAELASLYVSLPEANLTLNTVLKLEPDRLVLDPLNLALNGSEVSGSLLLLSGVTPTIEGFLESDRLDLPAFQRTEEVESGAPETDEAQESQTIDPADEPQPYVFVDVILPLDLLRNANVDFEVRVAELRYRGLQVANVAGNVGLNDSVLGVELGFDGRYGGKLSSQISLDASSSTPNFTGALFTRDLRLNLMSGPDAERDVVPEIGVTLEVESLGSTPRALASNSNGHLLITQGPGVIENRLVGRFSGDIVAQLFSAINPFSAKQEFSKWECTVIALQIEEGVGKLRGLLTQSKKVKVLGGGRIDLNNEKINLEFNTQPRKGIGISADMFVTPFVTLSGTIQNPGIGLNKTGVLIHGGAAVMTGGLSLLAKAAFDRAGGEVDRCATFREELGDHPPLPELSTSD